MDAKTTINLKRFNLEKRHLDRLHPDLQAGIVLTSYAVSESNMIVRMLVDAAHEKVGNRLVDEMTFSNRFFLIRTWSAKLFEFIEMLGAKEVRNADRTWADEAMTIRRRSENLRLMRGYSVANDMRHEAANHYSYKAARKNLSQTSQTADFSMYVSEMQGNSYFPSGEEVMFITRLSRNMSSTMPMDMHSLMDAWMDWNLATHNMLSEEYSRLLKVHVIDMMPDHEWMPVQIDVPERMVHRKGVATAPIFVQQ